jgi:hypothetical protein
MLSALLPSAIAALLLVTAVAPILLDAAVPPIMPKGLPPSRIEAHREVKGTGVLAE